MLTKEQKEEIKQLASNPDKKFKYMLLNRLQSDCYANCALWGINREYHAETMVALWSSLDKKPEWLPLKELKQLYYKLTRKEI